MGSKTVAAWESESWSGLFKIKLCSYPPPYTICLSLESISWPIDLGILKSKGESSTGFFSPKGIKVESTGI